jgi:hypothetical protein
MPWLSVSARDDNANSDRFFWKPAASGYRRLGTRALSIAQPYSSLVAKTEMARSEGSARTWPTPPRPSAVLATASITGITIKWRHVSDEFGASVYGRRVAGRKSLCKDRPRSALAKHLPFDRAGYGPGPGLSVIATTTTAPKARKINPAEIKRIVIIAPPFR